MSTLDCATAVKLIEAAARAVREHADELSRLDAVAGDGDHGVNMAAGFAEAERRIAARPHAVLADVFRLTGASFLEVVGGAAGALMGALFTALAGRLSHVADPGAVDFVGGLQSGLSRVMGVGKSGPGDKTMIDALHPAVEAAERALAAGGDLAQVTEAAAEGASRGAAKTADMRPTAGRARYAADQSIGTRDPGATSVAVVFRAWADTLTREVTS